MISKSEKALLNACAGHPLALQRLQEMHDVVEAARELVLNKTPFNAGDFNPLQRALHAGGWLDEERTS